MISTILPPDNILSPSIFGSRDYEMSALQDGGFVMVWLDPESLASMARIYNNDGTPRGIEIVVAGNDVLGAEGRTKEPHVTTLTDGSFVVTYEEFDFVGSYLYAKRYSPDGEILTDERLLHRLNKQGSHGAEIEALDNGGYAIALVQFDGSVQGVFTGRFSSDGISQTSVQRVNDTTEGTQNFIDIAPTASNGHVVVWASELVDQSNFAVLMKIYDSDGIALSPEILVNQTFAGNQNSPTVASLEDGSIVVVWHGQGASGLFGMSVIK